MSINVTVAGNPVSIKRGKMVTNDPEAAKKDFEKRRLLRLEQVRQQSKELAEDVRNKVKREKKRQLGEIEKEGKEKLINWQNRQLLELQNQYLNALDEIGTGHKEAEERADESEEYERQTLLNKEQAKHRGRVAATKRQVEKNEENYKKAKPLQHKKLVRDIENTRAAMVSSLKKKPAKKPCKTKTISKKTPKADINITIPNDSDFSEASTLSSSSDSSKGHSVDDEEHQHSEGFCECSDSSEEEPSSKKQTRSKPSKTRTPAMETIEEVSEHSRSKSRLEDEETKTAKLKSTTDACTSTSKLDHEAPRPRSRSEEFFPNTSKIAVAEKSKASPRQSYMEELEQRRRIIENFQQRPRDTPQDTRISDRIRRRQLTAQEPDYCDTLPHSTAISEHVQKDPLELSSDECLCRKTYGSCPCAKKVAAVQTELESGAKMSVKSLSIHQDIPKKPPIKIKDNATNTSLSAQQSRVRHYEHSSKFSSYRPSTSNVERIDADSIEVVPNLTSEVEWYQKMQQRDKEAQVRGKKALDKEKVHRDYEELMKKLPILQRKDHISRIGTDKPEYHMSRERLEERERQRQNRLENAYIDILPRPVTIPKRRHEIPTNPKVPFEVVNPEDPRSLNLASWDSNQQKTMFSADEVQEIIKAFIDQKPEERRKKLKQLLSSLKLQKEELLKEIRALPKDDSINALIDDLTGFDEKKSRKEDSDSSSGTPKARKLRYKYKKLRRPKVLQNMSTQTTPKPVKSSSTSTSTSTSSIGVQIVEPEPQNVKICTKNHTPCDCFKNAKSEEVCKILIQLNDEQTPKVVVTSARDKSDSDRDAGKLKTGSDRTSSPGPAPKKSVRDSETDSKDSSKKTSPRFLHREKSPRKDSFDEREKSKDSSKKASPRSPRKSDSDYYTQQKKDFPRPTTSKDSPKKTSSRSGRSHKETQPKSAASVPKKYSQNESWKEYFSKNSISTSSTSYLSPPDFSYQSLKDQDMMINYIKTLLSMSKNSVDDLGVSSSDVATPSQSVIEMASNNPGDKYIRYLSEPQMPERDIESDQQLFNQYAQVADSCTKRIANLAQMIEKLRQEKVQMLQTPPLRKSPNVSPASDQDNNSTHYYEFPPSGERSKGTNSTASIDEEELNRRLLEIDMSLADKLKKFREAKPSSPASEPDQEFLDRLQKLVHEPTQEESMPDLNVQLSFVPFLVDIPKLPILEPEPEGGPGKRHPPPSKGLITAKRFNENISLVPHELSTIVEAESQLSTKISPNTSKPLVDAEPEKSSSNSVSCTEGTCASLASSGTNSKLSSSSSDANSIEAMLRSIGMEWAIPTLQKTQEALALTTSTSTDASKKNNSTRKSSSSEVSLKEFLKRQLMSKVSSSSLRSEASPASFVRECSELSAIQNSSSEKNKQRTSTPLLSNKSRDKFFTGTSDISSVRSADNSGKTFQSLAGEESSVTKSSVEQ